MMSQMTNDGTLLENVPVIVEVFPHAESPELADGQRSGFIDAEIQIVLDHGRANALERCIDVDSTLIEGRRFQ